MNIEERNAMVVEHLPMVKSIASKLKKGLTSNVLFDDLVSDGVFGLMNATKRFDPDRGVTFPTFASHRVRGAMLDMLRKYSWVSRVSLARINKYRQAVSLLRQKLERNPTTQEVARRMRMTQEMVESIKMDEHLAFVPEEVDMGMDDDGNTLTSFTRDRRVRDPGESASYKDQARELLSWLSLRERQIATLYFMHEFTLKKIGVMLHISESRVCKIVNGIKSQLGKRTALSA